MDQIRMGIRRGRGLLLLLLAFALLAGCAAGPEADAVTATAAASPAPADTPLPTAEPEEAATEEKADFAQQVFDTAQDAGRLTARYLRLLETYGSGDSTVTTGDSAVYTSPEGLVMLVDCGNVAGGAEVAQQLQAMGVTKLDIVVLSHPHADHVGGFCTIADLFPIGQVYMNGHEYDSDTYRATVAKIEEKQIPCDILKAGDGFAFGEQVQVRVYGPEAGDADSVAAGYQDANDTSLALRLTYGASSFWTSGDLYITGEQRICEQYQEQIQSDVVKMNHHGKDTSNGRDFVGTLSPKIAVGMFDSVGSQTVAMRYQVAGAQVYYNSVDGAIRVSTAGDGVYDVQTQYLRDIAMLPDPDPSGHYTVE